MDITQYYFGANAVHAALNYVIQPHEHNRAAIVGITSFADKMQFGGADTHTLVMCDVIIRPHLVITSNHLQGAGLASIARNALSEAGIDDWLANGRVVIKKS